MKQVKLSFIVKLLGRILPGIVLGIFCITIYGNWWSASASNEANNFLNFAVGSSNIAQYESKKTSGSQSRDDEAQTESEQKELKSFIFPFSTTGNYASSWLPFTPETSMTKAIIKRGFNLNGRIEGSVQQLSGENTTFNSSAVLTGDLFVPGSPNLVRNGTSTFGGTVQGSGNAQPSNYSITLNGGSQLGRLMTRTDAVVMPTVAAPPAPTGTRNVTINNSSQSIGDFATLKNLTLNSNVGNKAILPGTYGSFTANSGSGFILGTAGSSEPAVYNLTSLTLNNSQLQVVGPVILTLKNTLTLNGSMGSSDNPAWLEIRISSGGVTLNSGSVLYGSVVAPSGTATINSQLTGNVIADRLTVNSGGVLRIIQGESDTTPPVITIQQPNDGLVTNATQITVSGTYSDESPTTITVNGNPATIQGNTFSINLPLIEGENEIHVVAVDIAGNQSTASRIAFRRSDNSPPRVKVLSPANGTIVNSSQIQLVGEVNDASQVAVEVNGMAVNFVSNTFSVLLELVEGNNKIQIQAVDAYGNKDTLVHNVIKDSIPPELNVISPVENQAVDRALIIGTATDESKITLKLNDVEINFTGEGSIFRSEIQVSEGNNQVQVTASDSLGNTSNLVRNFVYDKTPPVISDVNPPEGTKVGQSITVSGKVTDISATTVIVNGIQANVQSNGQFIAENVSFTETNGELEIVATDSARNATTSYFAYELGDQTPPNPPVIFPLVSTTRLNFQTIEGRSEPDAIVEVRNGDFTSNINAAQGTGLFAINVPLQQGSNLIIATARDLDGNSSTETRVLIESDPTMSLPSAGEPFRINISTGSQQKGLTGMEMPRPLIAIVTDINGTPVSAVEVKFTRLYGDGKFPNNEPISTSITDERGYASVGYISGTVPGPQQINAKFIGNTQTNSTFLLETLDSNSGINTSVSGLVTDQNLRALPNVLVRIGGQQVRTTTDGRFVVNNVSAGPHQILEIIGRGEIQLPGRWTNISYDIDVLPGINNDLGRPLFLPRVNEGINLPLNDENIVTRDTAVELPVVGGGVPVKIVAKAGTHVSFPVDVADKRLSVTRIATNRVPMTLEDGLATNLYISVQPSGAVFEPALEVSFPNLDGLAANSEVLLMSFDHEAGRYVRVGTGHTSSDASIVKSDPGSGIHVGAWHALPPPAPQPEVTVLGHIQVEGNPIFEDRVINKTEAWVEGARAVPLFTLSSQSSNAQSGVVPSKLDYRATFPLPPNRLGIPARMESTTQTVQTSVDSVSWVKINAEVINDPNNNAEKRMYADKEKLNSAGDMTVVKVKASVNPVVKGAVVYFKSFDPDDPSSDDKALDSTPIPNTGDDNRGKLPKAGKLSAIAPVGSNGVAKAVTDQNGEATVTLKVATHPGNNYRVAASTKNNYVQTLVVKGIDVQEPNGNTLANGKSNELLTVWRRLHIERDSMAAPNAQDIKKNKVTGNIVKIEEFNDMAIKAKLTVDSTSKPIDDDSPLMDGSNGTPCQSGIKPLYCAGRFQNGSVELGTGSQTVTIGDLSGNGADFIQKSPEVDITVTGINNPVAGGSLISVTNNPTTGTPTQSIVEFYLTYGKWNLITVGSQITVGGVTLNVASVNAAAGTVTTTTPLNISSISSNSFQIPFTVSDNNQNTVTGNIISFADFIDTSGTTPVIKSNVKLKITSGTLSNTFIGGQLSIAGETRTIDFVDPSNNLVRTGAQLKIPYVLSDDDIYQGLPLAPNIVDFQDYYDAAYILIVDDGGGNPAFSKLNVPFIPFFEDTGTDTLFNWLSKQNAFESKANKADDFWIMYLQTAFQGTGYDKQQGGRGDSDPDAEILISAAGYAIGSGTDTIGAYAFVETTRDNDAQGYVRPIEKYFIHEGAHEWELQDCYGISGNASCTIPNDIMGEGLDCPTTTTVNCGGKNPEFSPRDLNIIRNSVKGP